MTTPLDEFTETDTLAVMADTLVDSLLELEAISPNPNAFALCMPLVAMMYYAARNPDEVVTPLSEMIDEAARKITQVQHIVDEIQQ